MTPHVHATDHKSININHFPQGLEGVLLKKIHTCVLSLSKLNTCCMHTMHERTGVQDLLLMNLSNLYSTAATKHTDVHNHKPRHEHRTDAGFVNPHRSDVPIMQHASQQTEIKIGAFRWWWQWWSPRSSAHPASPAARFGPATEFPACAERAGEAASCIGLSSTSSSAL